MRQGELHVSDRQYTETASEAGERKEAGRNGNVGAGPSFRKVSRRRHDQWRR
jgi:hypothetical protein